MRIANTLHELSFVVVNQQYDEVKERAKELLDKAKEEYNTLDPDDINDFQAVRISMTDDDAAPFTFLLSSMGNSH